MPESQTHIDLVKILNLYICDFLYIEKGYILVDSSYCSPGSKPPLIGSYRPDIYAKTKKLLIIGDAKTEQDWDRKHSMEQYKAFLDECKRSELQAFFLIAVPWRVERSTRSRIKRTFPASEWLNVDIRVISDMWSWEYAEDTLSKRAVNYS